MQFGEQGDMCSRLSQGVTNLVYLDLKAASLQTVTSYDTGALGFASPEEKWKAV